MGALSVQLAQLVMSFAVSRSLNRVGNDDAHEGD